MFNNMFSNKNKIVEFGIVLFLIAVGISLRLLPHPPNFAPIAAIALFAGAYLSKKTAFILPVVIMVLSDIFFGHYELFVMASVYASFLLTVGLGIFLKKHKKWYAVAGGAVLASVLFFLITNFAVWAFSPWYAKTLSGLVLCFTMALPFFKNTLAGNLVYTTAFFGAYSLIQIWLRNKSAILKPCAVKGEGI